VNESVYHPPDIAQFWGTGYYSWPEDAADENKKQGVSRMVPKTAIPEIEVGMTRIVGLHSRAIVTVHAEGMTLRDLLRELIEEHADEVGSFMHDADLDDWEMYISTDPQYPEFPQGITRRAFTNLLRVADEKGDLKRLEEKYGIRYDSGFFGYGWATSVQWVAPTPDTPLPEELRGVAGIKPVYVEYDDEPE
jgi:hypothetical protein